MAYHVTTNAVPHAKRCSYCGKAARIGCFCAACFEKRGERREARRARANGTPAKAHPLSYQMHIPERGWAARMFSQDRIIAPIRPIC